MDLYEQIAKERIDAALREAEQRRAIHLGRARRSTTSRVGSALVRLGRWMVRHSSGVAS